MKPWVVILKNVLEKMRPWVAKEQSCNILKCLCKEGWDFLKCLRENEAIACNCNKAKL